MTSHGSCDIVCGRGKAGCSVECLLEVRQLRARRAVAYTQSAEHIGNPCVNTYINEVPLIYMYLHKTGYKHSNSCLVIVVYT